MLLWQEAGGGKLAAAASLQELSASQESEDTLRSSSSGGHSSASMSVHELASPSLHTDEVHACVRASVSVCLACVCVHSCLCVRKHVCVLLVLLTFHWGAGVYHRGS